MIDDFTGTASHLGLQAHLGKHYQADTLVVSKRMGDWVLFCSFHIFVHGAAQLPASSKATVVNQARKWTPIRLPSINCGTTKLASRGDSPCKIQLVIALDVGSRVINYHHPMNLKSLPTHLRDTNLVYKNIPNVSLQVCTPLFFPYLEISQNQNRTYTF